MARPKGIPAWNKGKTNVEIFGAEKAAKINKKHADAAKITKNRLGTSTSEEARKNIGKAKLGKTSHRKNISNIEEYGLDKAAELFIKKSVAALVYRQEHPHTPEENQEQALRMFEYWKEKAKPYSRDCVQYSAWKEYCLRRDKYMCTNCKSIDCLHVHHIKDWDNYPDLRYSPSNGITLCDTCHATETQRLLKQKVS